MPFSSLLFVCVFMPVCIGVTWLSPARARNAVVLAFSLAFYAWGAPRFLPVICALGVADYALARGISRAAPRTRRMLLAGGIVVHVSVLAYFKYGNFFVAQLNDVRSALGHAPIPWVQIVLPIGVSFLTFEEISYLTDVYRGHAKPARRWTDYLLFLMLFPHSIAGPIFRWKDLEAQLEKRSIDKEGVLRGVVRFSMGLAKKVLVADSVAHIADAVYGLGPGEVTAFHAWVGTLAYAVQIYFDFSGYSDMAIGLGAMLGFSFKENFREPYTSRSINEFWQRWHISLSTWMRDYLYVPLGGNRRGKIRTELNVLFVFAVSGFWHGASWAFLLWGLYHGVLVTVERRLEPRLGWIPGYARALVTFVLVVIGWVPFRASSFSQLREMAGAMLGLAHATVEPRLLPAEIFPRSSVVFLCGAVAHLLVRMWNRSTAETSDRLRLPSSLVAAASLALLVTSIMHMTNMRYTPLIYFKF